MNEELKKIISFCIENMEAESSFLTPMPRHKIDLVSLFDKLSEIFNVDKNIIGEYVDEIQGVR